MSLDLILDQIAARANAATPGPWHQDPTNDIGDWLVGTSTSPVADCDFAELNREEIDRNANFIAAARSDVPALVKLARFADEFIGEIGCGRELQRWRDNAAQLLRETEKKKDLGK